MLPLALHSRRTYLLLLALACVAALYAACTPWANHAANQRPQASLRYGVDVDAMSLDPRTVRNTTDFRIVNLIYDGLIHLDQSLHAQPALAVSWQQLDPLTLVFALRTDAHFQDGTAVTAADVVFTYRSILDPSQHSSYASLLAPIASVTALDQYHVKFSLTQPFAPLLQYLEIGIVPEHLANAHVDLSTHPVGSGRYRFVHWTRGSEITLQPNPDHAGMSTADAAIQFVPIADNTARAQALEAGDLDIITSPMDAADVTRLGADKRFRHQHLPGLKITYLNFNTRNPPLNDPALRYALAGLVDRATIAHQIFGDTEQAASSILLPSLSWSFTKSIQQPAFDPQQARATLSLLGWKRGDDGMLVRNGQHLHLTLSTHSEDSARIQSLEFIQHALRDAGIDAQVAIADFPAFINNVRQGRYDIALLGWDNIVDPDQLMYEQLHSGGELNWGSYRDPQIDALLQDGRSSGDSARRARDYQAAAERVAQQVPYLVLTYAGFDAFSSTRAHGVAVDARGFVSMAPSPSP